MPEQNWSHRRQGPLFARTEVGEPPPCATTTVACHHASSPPFNRQLLAKGMFITSPSIIMMIEDASPRQLRSTNHVREGTERCKSRLRRDGALAWNRRKMKTDEQFQSMDTETSSKERKRYKRRKRVKVENQVSDESMGRKCEATIWWSEISSLCEELEWATSCNCISNYRDYNQNISNMFSLPPCKSINNGSDACTTLNLPEIKCSTTSIIWDTGLIPSSELCYSSSERGGGTQQQRNDCALSSQFSQSSCVLQSQAESWVSPPTPGIVYGEVEDLNWLRKTSSHGKSNPNQTQMINDHQIHTPADKFPLYPSIRYLPEAGTS